MPSSEVSPAPTRPSTPNVTTWPMPARQLTRMRERTAVARRRERGRRLRGVPRSPPSITAARALQDDPDIPLFFGRIDVIGRAKPGRWYIGRRHIHDEAGDPLVVDWRADVSRAVLPRHPAASRWASRCAGGSASTAAL